MDSPWCETTDDSWGLCESTCSIEGKYFIVKSIFLPLNTSYDIRVDEWSILFWIDSEGTQEPATVPNENALTTSAQSRIGKYYWLIDLQLIISMSKYFEVPQSPWFLSEYEFD